MDASTKICSILLVTTCLLVLATPTSISSSPQRFASSNYTAQYAVFDEILTISIQPSLYAYYNNLSHVIPTNSQYAKFITPQTIQPIADTIRSFTQNMSNHEEEFANAVLSFVHQIPYNITGAKFPIETLIENRGDCGAVSLLAASIMKAGGLDVVLIKYTTADFAHMNVGVYLPYTPTSTTLFFGSTSLQFDNKTYWTAEATPRADWKVGDQPLLMSNALIEFIPIDECEETLPGQISCSLSSLMPSTITMDIFSKPSHIEMNRSLLISGSIQPNAPNSSITIYINKNGSYKDYIKTLTDSEGSYSYLWNFTSDGTYYILASHSGNATYAGADSESVAVFIGPSSPLLFQSEAYNYIVGIGVADIAVRPYMGVKDFLNASVGNVSFSYNFCLLSTGQSTSDIETRKITIPERHLTFRDRLGRQQIVEVPAKTRIVPEKIPLGQQPLALPVDFNETINSQFCFTIQKTPEGNYSLNAQGLDGYDINGIRENSNILFFNATEGITENQWYKVATKISEDGVTVDLQSEGDMPIQSLWAPNSVESTVQMVLLVANNVDGAIVLKDVQVNDGKTPVEATPQIVHQPPPPMKSLLSFAIVIVVMASLLIILGVTINVKNRRQPSKGRKHIEDKIMEMLLS